MNELIHPAKRGHVRILGSGVQHPAPAQHIVERYHAAAANQVQALLVVAGVASLVGVDKREIESRAVSRGDQTGQRLFGRGDSKIDLAGDARFSPVTACRSGVLLTDVACHDAAIGRQCQRHRERTVSGKHAHFDHAPRARHPDENLQKLPLFRRNLKIRFWMPRRFLPQASEDIRFADADAENVIDNFGVDQAFVASHALSSLQAEVWQTDFAGVRVMKGILIALAVLAVRPLAAQVNQRTDSDKAIADLRHVANELDEAVKHFQAHLDREISMHDRGYQAKGGRRIPGADADFSSGQADVIQTAIRKLFAARMIAARRPGYEPAPLADFDRIQALIAEARSRIDLGNGLMRRLLVVSAKELNPRTYAAEKANHDDLLKARNAAAEAAKKALVVLPVALPEADSPEQQRDRAWDAPVLPIRFEVGKKVILVNEHFCRIALTDSGLEDKGRRLFYEEDWMTRQGSIARTTGTGPAGIVLLMRWAVAVDTTTGQHTLLRRYEPREFQGDVDGLYEGQGSDYVSNVKLPVAPALFTTKELLSAVESAERSRAELQQAVLEFRRQVREALAGNDALLSAEDKLPLDDDLVKDLREKLFAIRGHIAGAAAIVDGENKVRRALDGAASNVRDLEALTAWIDGSALERAALAQDSRALLDAQNRADAGIHSIRSLEKEALAALPPDLPMSEAQLPALKKDVIVRIRRLGGSAGITRYRQEVWRLEGSAHGARQVTRTIVLLEMDSKSGSQIPTAREFKSYPIEVGDTLEEIYDENAAQ